MLTRKQLNNIMEVLKKVKFQVKIMIQLKFFFLEIMKKKFLVDHNIIKYVPEGINRNISLIYDISGNSKKRNLSC